MGHDDGRVLVYRARLPIRWGDMDVMGHVNNTVYFRFMEQLRIQWFEHLGFPPDPGGQGPVIVNAACEFRRELNYPGDVLLEQYAGELGRSSFMTWTEMRHSSSPEEVSAAGSAKCVWVDFPRRKSVPMPDAVRALVVRPWQEA